MALERWSSFCLPYVLSYSMSPVLLCLSWPASMQYQLLLCCHDVCVCVCALPSIGKNTSPCPGGERGVPGSDNRWRPVSEACLVMIWETVLVLICGEPPRNTGFSWPRASLCTCTNSHTQTRKETTQMSKLLQINGYNTHLLLKTFRVSCVTLSHSKPDACN